MKMMRNPSHPGEIVRECIEGLKLNVSNTAKALGVTRVTLSRLLNAKSKVSPDMAVRLSKAFGSTTGFWLRLQLNFDLAQIEKRASRINVRRISSPEQLALH